ncbi:MAG: glutamate--tRNA ligase, partial [Actinobacteria bacterium]|nr:glutamate--tRNA ligase [Actinomycetota bacterium]
YRDAGYLPTAVVNYLALLGWNPGDDDTVVDLPTMIERFELDRVSKNPAIFDITKLEWMNGVYIREMDQATFVETVTPLVEADLGRELDARERGVLSEMAPLVQERAKTLTEIAPQMRFLFADISYDESSWKKVMTKPDAGRALRAARGVLVDLDEFSTESVEAALRGMLESEELNPRKGFQPLRVALSGSSVSPPLFESVAALGKERTLARLDAAALAIDDAS